MVTKVSNVEFENMWNAIVRKDEFDSEYDKTHWAGGHKFTLEEIERNKPDGWDELREIIDEIEESCVVYYFCSQVSVYRKCLWFIVYGNNAIENFNKIRKQCDKMRGFDLNDDSGYGAGIVNGTMTAQCPLF